MCVAVPMKVRSIEGPMCTAEIGGVSRQVSVLMMPEVKVGDYIIVHAGYAIERLDEDEALRTLELFRQLGELMGDEPQGHE
jgi:hydrogenase expression/formation protein HypC